MSEVLSLDLRVINTDTTDGDTRYTARTMLSSESSSARRIPCRSGVIGPFTANGATDPAIPPEIAPLKNETRTTMPAGRFMISSYQIFGFFSCDVKIGGLAEPAPLERF